MAITFSDLEVLRPAALEAEGRPYRVTQLEVLDYQPTYGDLDTILVRPGCIGVFVGPKPSPLIAAVRHAIRANDGTDQRLANTIREQLAGRARIALEDAVDLLVQQPVFASIRYGGRTLVSSLFAPPGLPMAAVAIPYNGGTLAPRGFSLVEHYTPGATDALDAVLVRHTPQLTKGEKAALDRLPTDLAEMNVGTAALCFALSAVAIASAVCLATGICCPHRPRVPRDDEDFATTPDFHLQDEQLTQMNPALAARHLLRIRRDALEGRF